MRTAFQCMIICGLWRNYNTYNATIEHKIPHKLIDNFSYMYMCMRVCKKFQSFYYN